ncbi:MAG: hypothetical protein ACE5FC_00790, partial [Myxococcota bacterium]
GVYIAGSGGLLPIALPSGGGKARAQNLRILEARCGQEPLPLLLGGEHALVALSDEKIRAAGGEAKVSVASAREAWKSLQARFILLRRRLLSALDSQLAIRLLFRGAIARQREFALQLDALARSLDALREVVREGICACEEAGLSGVWSERIPALAELASIHVAGIDRQFAQLALNHLFDGPVEEIFADSLGRESCRREKSACPRCRSPLTRTRFKAASGDRDGWTRVDCPTCGFREGWSRRANRLVVKTPGRVSPGSDLGVELRWSSGPLPVQGSLPLNFLAVEFKDKGKGRPFYSQLLQTSDSRVKLGFRAPKDLSPDLHSAIAFRAAGLDFGLARVRCAGVPAASKAWFDEQFRRTERN